MQRKRKRGRAAAESRWQSDENPNDIGVQGYILLWPNMQNWPKLNGRTNLRTIGLPLLKLNRFAIIKTTASNNKQQKPMITNGARSWWIGNRWRLVETNGLCWTMVKLNGDFINWNEIFRDIEIAHPSWESGNVSSAAREAATKLESHTHISAEALDKELQKNF